MAPIPGEPRESPKPQPIGDMTMIFLFTAFTLCGFFMLWRRADSLRRVVSHKLKNLTSSEGRIRLSEDDAPPANVFIVDDYDDDHEQLRDTPDEPLSHHIQQARRAWREPNLSLSPDNQNGAWSVMSGSWCV